MYRKTIENLYQELDSKVTGLGQESVDKKIEEFGYNELTAKKPTPLIVRFFLQFKDVLIIILLIAAIISIIADPNEWVDSLIILIVVSLNAILGVVQEAKASKSLEALKKMSQPQCKVIRNGATEIIDKQFLVPGDIIQIEAGDFIPADSRIIEAYNLQIDESCLTGESVPVEKNANVIAEENVPIGDQKNMLFSSTFATNGTAKALVVKTGMNTEIGNIANLLLSDDETVTPLQNKLNQIGKIIGILSLVICALVFVMEILSGLKPLEAFKTSIALAVAAIPEGLAAIITVVLAIGVEKLAKEKAIVKKLPAVETLGSTYVICTDKTGTLTENKMQVTKYYYNGIKELTSISDKEKSMFSYFALCSNASVNEKGQSIGDPTEVALINVNNLYGKNIKKIPRLLELPFDSERKLMTVVVKIEDKLYAITKGAPDVVIKSSTLSEEEKAKAIASNNQMSQDALRVLAVSFKEIPEIDTEKIEENLEFVGLVGMIDKERIEVKKAIEVCKQAGIKTVMITGDHVVTASAIGKRLGMIQTTEEAVSKEELDNMTDEELTKNIEKYSVFARVSPNDKVRIVSAWQNNNKVVAMTGDGVNDAPALKMADIGCAMGITGTDVAKESSDLVLSDDNFETIVKAVKQGRGIYGNIRKVISYLLSSNIGEVFTIFLASIICVIFGLELGVPLLPIHLLWINLITDSLPAFGLGVEQADSEVMQQKPRPKNESFFSNNLGVHIFIQGFIIGLLTLIAFFIGSETSRELGVTMAFMTLSLCQLFHAFNVKSEHSIISKKTFNNKLLLLAFFVGLFLQLIVVYLPLNDIFKLIPLEFNELGICFLLGFSIIILVEIKKLIIKLIKK